MAGPVPLSRGGPVVPLPSYVLVTPARNEEATLETTIQCVLAQTLAPQEWVIVSDGSTDRTDDIVRRHARHAPLIHFIRLDGRPARNFASVVFATDAGCRALRTRDYDFVGLLDADVRFQPDYFASLTARCAANPQLGLAVGAVRDVVDGRSWDDPQNLEAVAGATQFFRRDCFEALGGLIPVPEGGWDALTCVQARRCGYKTQTFPDLRVEHLKPRNAAFGHPLRRKWQLGLRDYALAYHPLYELLKCASRLRPPPLITGAAAWFLGYCWATCSRRRRVLAPEIVRFIREEQLDRLSRLVRRRPRVPRALA